MIKEHQLALTILRSEVVMKAVSIHPWENWELGI